MDNHTNDISGPFSTGLSIFATVLTWISIRDVQIFFGIGASCVAMVSGFYAIKHYKKQLKK